MEVYIDNMVVKTGKYMRNLSDLEEPFIKLVEYKRGSIQPNAHTGYIVASSWDTDDTQGIKASINQVKIIVEMPSPLTKKEIEQLTRRLAVLARFIARYSDKCQHFFKATQS